MSVESERPGRPRLLLVILPLVVFLALAAIFMAQLLSGRDESIVPSALLNQPAPQTDLPPVEGMDLPGLNSDAFKGKVTLVNVWGSWCVPCRAEQPVLMALSRDDRFVLAGMDYKDKPENARRFLNELGNPFDAIGVDASGRTGIDWGVYGVPETFVIGKDGTILFKHVGPLTPDDVTGDLMPRIEKALSDR